MNIKTLKPSYYDDFHCICGDCKQNCCTDGWRIDISKNNYNNIKKVKTTPEFKATIEKLYKREAKPISDAAYAHIVLTEDGGCPFFGEDGLCTLQKNCGYNVLSDVCKYFPRKFYAMPQRGLPINTINENSTVEMAVDTACEAVVMQLLKYTNGLEFVNGEVSKSEDFLRITQIANGMDNDFYDYYWDIKTLCIATLQATNHSLDDRILIMGMFLQKIVEYKENKQLEEIPTYVDRMMIVLESGELANSFDDIKPDFTNEMAELYLVVNNINNESKNKETKLDSFLTEMFLMKDIGEKNYKMFFNEEIYAKKKVFFDKYCEKNPRALENVIVNYFFAYVYPFCKKTMWDSFGAFCIYYSYMKRTIIGFFDENSGDDDFISGVVYVSRKITHNVGLLDQILEGYNKANGVSLVDFARLVKG